MRCRGNRIEQRLTKVKHSWTNRQLERVDRTIKETTVKRHLCDSHQQVETHLSDVIAGCSYAHRLKSLRGLTPTGSSAQHGATSLTASPLTAPPITGTKHLRWPAWIGD